MKIAFFITPRISCVGRSDGIRMQALEWKIALESRGYSVDLVNPWNHYDWHTYDILHFFALGEWLTIIPILSKKNPNIAISPIIDSTKTTFSYKIASYTQIPSLRLYSNTAIYRNVSKYIKIHFARSNYEKSFIKAATYNPKIKIVPLAPRIPSILESTYNKENFCLHVSSFTQTRKNVMRLMQASVKYNFNLVIAGNKGSEESFKPFKDFAEKHDNVKILGFQTEEDLINLYSKAKVFALPSVAEGVGLVALEAAVRGCEIVMTKIGGPKEYYADNAYFVNPYSVDDIGKAVVNAINNSKQPDLKNRICQLYNQSRCINLLIDGYNSIL